MKEINYKKIPLYFDHFVSLDSVEEVTLIVYLYCLKMLFFE